MPILLLGAAALLILLSSKARGRLEDLTDAASAAWGTDMLSEHFSLAELTTTGQRDGADEDGDGNTTERAPNVPTAAHRANLAFLAGSVLEPLRALWGGRPVRVTSGYRSAAVNAGAGGSSTSDHPKGLAADVYVDGLTNAEAAELAYTGGEGIPFDQIIVEHHTGHLHIGAGTAQRRQFLQTYDGVTYSAWAPASIA